MDHNEIVFRWRGFLNPIEPKIYDNDTIDKRKNIKGFDHHDCVILKERALYLLESYGEGHTILEFNLIYQGYNWLIQLMKI